MLGVSGSLLGCPSDAPAVSSDAGTEMSSGTTMGTDATDSGSTSGSGTSTGGAFETSTSDETGEASTSMDTEGEASTTSGESGSESPSEGSRGSAGSEGGPNVPPEIVDVAVAVDGVRVQLTVEATDTDGEVRSIAIDWGDDQTEEIDFEAPATILAHDYAVPTDYEIALFVVDDDGAASATVEQDVTSGIPAGEIAFFPFAGTADDALGTSTSLYGSPVYETDRFGMGERALNLYANNSANEGVLISTGAPPVSGSFTLSTWVYFTNGCGPCGNELRYVGFGRWFNLFSGEAGNRVSFGLLGEDPEVDDASAISNVELEVGTWYHLVGVLDASGGSYTTRLYRNGMLDATSSVDSPVPRRPDCRFYIGPSPAGDPCSSSVGPEFQNFPGRLDDVRLYDRALSDVEVRALFHEGEYVETVSRSRVPR